MWLDIGLAIIHIIYVSCAQNYILGSVMVLGVRTPRILFHVCARREGVKWKGIEYLFRMWSTYLYIPMVAILTPLGAWARTCIAYSPNNIGKCVWIYMCVMVVLLVLYYPIDLYLWFKIVRPRLLPAYSQYMTEN